MFRLLWAASVHTRNLLRRHMPTNILLDAIRTRRGLKWGVPAMLLAVPYLFAASACSAWVANGGPGWANVLVLLFAWNALKFIAMGPTSLVPLMRARAAERISLQRHMRSEADGASLTGHRVKLTSRRSGGDILLPAPLRPTCTEADQRGSSNPIRLPRRRCFPLGTGRSCCLGLQFFHAW